MGDDDVICQPSKKRAAGIQLSRDNNSLDEDNEGTSEPEAGTLQRASEEVLATRKIVRVRRQQKSSTSLAADPPPASNPFAAIQLVPPGSASVEVEASGFTINGTKGIDINNNKGGCVADDTKDDESGADAEPSERNVNDSKVELNSEKDEPAVSGEQSTIKPVPGKLVEGENSRDGNGEATEVAGNGDEDARNDIRDEKNDEEQGAGEATTENKAETASINSFQQLSSSQNAFSGLAQTGSSSTSFAFGSTPQDRPLMGSTSGTVSMLEVPVETGEENEMAVFTSNSVLYEFADGSWKERGKGELKLNVPSSGTGKARLVMRARGHYRLILNASLFPEMKLTSMDKKGISFTCINSASEGKASFSTIALKFKDASVAQEFQAAVMLHKTDPSAALRTPENSPRRSAE